MLSSRGSFSEELCLECGSYAVRSDDTLSEVSWTQEFEDDSTLLSHCENSMACHVEVGAYLNVAVHAEDGFHHGDWADEVSWKLYYKETNQLLLRGGSPYAASVCLPRGQHTLVRSVRAHVSVYGVASRQCVREYQSRISLVSLTHNRKNNIT